MKNEKNLREEVLQVIINNSIKGIGIAPARLIGDVNELTDKILALEPYATVERVREYCEKELKFWKGYVRLRENYNDGLRNGRIETLEEILSILNQQEGEFDVREWCEEKVKEGYYTTNEDYTYFLHNSDKNYHSIKINLDHKSKSNRLRIIGFGGDVDIPIEVSKSFFLQLLDALRVKI